MRGREAEATGGLRIAQVVTLLSADGAFGGPARVLEGQVNELAARGHSVTVYAGWDGAASTRFSAEVDTNLFRVTRVVPGGGFSGLAAPNLALALRRRGPEFDVVHVHLARDLVTLPAGALAGTRLVAQPHGMILPDDRVKSRVVDRLATRRILRQAGAVLYLTEQEKAGLTRVAGTINLRRLPNGIRVADAPVADGASRTVLFCARLHPRKRVLTFLDMARRLLQRGVVAEFVIAGPDGGDLERLRTAIGEDCEHIRYIGAVAPESVADLLAAAAVFVLPSVDEPFPMTVLEALAAGTPAVLTDTCGISGDLKASGAATVTDGSVEQLADAVQALLDPAGPRTNQIAAGRTAVRARYSIAAVVDRLETIYRELATGTRSGAV